MRLHIKLWQRIAAGCLVSTLVLTLPATAQYYSNVPALLQPSGTQYFQNQYLANPALAGADSGLHLNAAHRRQFNGIEGSPVTTFFTADGAFGNRGGGGLNIFNDKAGLLHRTRVALSYAYHMPLRVDGTQQLHFGLSVAVNNQRVSSYELNGDAGDPSLAAFNKREDYFEGEYGMAFTDPHWTIQGALPNLRSLFTGKEYGINGGQVAFAAASYKIGLSGSVNAIEPKVAYRNIKGYDGIFDLGVRISFLDNVAQVTGLYHTSGSFTAGMGVQIARLATLQLMYTSQTNGVKTNVDGIYELGVGVNLFR